MFLRLVGLLQYHMVGVPQEFVHLHITGTRLLQPARAHGNGSGSQVDEQLPPLGHGVVVPAAQRLRAAILDILLQNFLPHIGRQLLPGLTVPSQLIGGGQRGGQLEASAPQIHQGLVGTVKAQSKTGPARQEVRLRSLRRNLGVARVLCLFHAVPSLLFHRDGGNPGQTVQSVSRSKMRRTACLTGLSWGTVTLGRPSASYS